jgi:hypothetical protein
MLPSARAHLLEEILATGSRLELQRDRQVGLGGACGYLVTELHQPPLTAWREYEPQADLCVGPPCCGG